MGQRRLGSGVLEVTSEGRAHIVEGQVKAVRSPQELWILAPLYHLFSNLQLLKYYILQALQSTLGKQRAEAQLQEHRTNQSQTVYLTPKPEQVLLGHR